MPTIAQTPPFDASALLEWYDAHGRSLPWRAAESPDPYKVWLSEIMLQQTTTRTVRDYFDKFLRLWPDLRSLAQADLDDVLANWAGLGYYRRAQNLHKAARLLGEAGRFPRTPEDLIKIPGIGPYTSAAIAAIAFNHPIVPIDGNVERITARYFALPIPLPAGKSEMDAYARTLNHAPAAQTRAGDFAQALFDLGATVCTPRKPKCAECPVRTNCLGRARNISGDLPVKSPKKPKKELFASCFVITDKNRTYLGKRAANGLLPNTFEPPGTMWSERLRDMDDALREAFQKSERKVLENGTWMRTGQVRHIFTHIKLTVAVYVYRPSADACLHLLSNPDPAGHGRAFRTTEHAAISTLMKKILRSANIAPDPDLFGS